MEPAWTLMACALAATPPAPELAEPVVVCDNGGWCWFEDERAIVHIGTLYVGTVAHRRGPGGEARHGNIELTAVDLASGATRTAILHERLSADDHCSPALLVRPDGRIIAAYTKHSADALVRYRITEQPGDIGAWTPEQTVERPIRVCYSNVLRLAAENDGRGRIYDFYRGEGYDPNFLVSDDDGASWRYGGHLLINPGDDRARIRPYVKYAGDGDERIHFVATQGHPASEPRTGIYHGYLRGGVVHRSDGTPIRSLGEGPVDPEELTCIYPGGPDNWAWTMDLHLDAGGHPYTVYSVHLSDQDHRYRYARWDGRRWRDYPLAYAGERLYPGEDHYTGLAALDPEDPWVVYLSTNADPATGAPLVSAADGQRHWELYRADTDDSGASWRFAALTANSTADNLRPIVPKQPGGDRLVLWLRGRYTSYTDYRLEVVMARWPASETQRR